MIDLIVDRTILELVLCVSLCLVPRKCGKKFQCCADIAVFEKN